ncbi:MAG: hypothetical protein M1825_000056 [Sarcosagium campestre]|nr:MAG: hypothetical protein M1825_000056 [Sarcosagium campestre]
MILRHTSIALASLFLISSPLCLALSASEIPSDTPISSLIGSANSHLAKGNFNDALTYFDVAISRDPKNYLTIFKRGATYLSLGKTAQASQDFDTVLSIRPDFEGALLQRARIKSKNADWAGAKQDYGAAGKTAGQEMSDLEEAQGAASLAIDAEKRGQWEDCVSHAGVAIMTASASLSLRQLRSRCRLERGEVHEAVSDLAHVLQISPGSVEPHLQMSALMFYSLGDTDRGIAQIRKCLHSDPDSKACSKLFRREKLLGKQLERAKTLMEKRQFIGVTKVLLPTKDDVGLIQDVKDDVKAFREDGTIHAKAPEELHISLLEMLCQAFVEMNNLKRGAVHCKAALEASPNSLYGLISKANTQLAESDPEAALQTLKQAEEHHPSAPQLQTLIQKAQTALKRASQKDYYKVLGVSRDADTKTIKRAYRQLSKQHHPDKAMKGGVSKEDAEKKMAAINEAWEVLSNDELRARFDQGDDPMSHEGQGQQPFQGSPFGQGGGQQQQFFFRQGGGGAGGSGGGFKFPGGGFQFNFQ